MEKETSSRPVIILGGGISGLAAAWFLHKKRLPFLVIEKGPETGGKVKSDMRSDSVFDFGPASIRDKTGDIIQVAHELGLEDDIVEISEAFKTRFLVRDGKLHKIGPGIFSLLSTKILSNSGKRRILKEPFIPAGPVREESVGDFLERRIGKEAVDYLVDPIFSGIYAGDVYKLSKSMITPALAEMEQNYGSITKGGLKERKRKQKSAEKEKRKPTVLTFRKGLQQLTNALTEKLSDFIVYDEVQSIHKAADGFSVTTRNSEYKADKVISCLPANVLTKVVIDDFKLLSRVLEKVVYAPVLVTQLIYNSAEVDLKHNGFGFLVPHAEKRGLLGAIWKSRIFPEMTKTGKLHFTLMSGGAGNPGITEVPVEVSEQNALQDFSALMNFSAKPEIIQSVMWEKAIPQFNVGFKLIRQKINDFAAQTPGFFVGSNFMWGVSVPECLEGAKKLTDELTSA